jgi:RNAse (barnase) inhibitor barstar
MRNHLDILEDIYQKLASKSLNYELNVLKNEVSHHFNATELIGESSSILLKMKEVPDVHLCIGQLIDEFMEFAKSQGIQAKLPSTTYSCQPKEFFINGIEFSNLKGFYNVIGSQLVENNNWGKNWNALNDILIGGFGRTEYGEPYKLTWINSNISRTKLEDFDYLVQLIGKHQQIEFELK